MPCWEVWSSIDSDAFPLLKLLCIRGCPKLRGDLPDYLPALEILEVTDCELLVSSLPRVPAIRRIVIRKTNKVELNVFPLLVESIEVEGSPMVESMMEAITNTQPTCLQYLTIQDCSSAISFSGGCLHASLKTLNMSDLKKLEFSTHYEHELLETLEICRCCGSLTSLSSITFPNLKCLRLWNCENMESLLDSVSESPNNLSSFDIRNCPNLTSITVSDCEKLKSLPDQLSTLIPKLEYLEIWKCLQIKSFPKVGMPPKLRTVDIINCEKLLSSLAWPSMDMLTFLSVGGPCDSINCFPKEGLLPPSLTTLYLYNLSSLETLDCKGLLHLTSLQQLRIGNCKKLKNIAGERLPDPLILLNINGCPLLEKGCCMKHSQIWPIISHVRGIEVGDKLI